MDSDAFRFFYDFADPLSFLFDHALRTAEEETGVTVARVPLELRPPPLPLTDTDDRAWADRWSDADESAPSLGVRLMRPSVVPWTRKAHELCVHAAARGRDESPGGPAVLADREAVHSVFQAFMTEGRDIGRVDVLVILGQALGLDFTETKAALDVDRYTADVESARQLAADLFVAAPPALVGPTGRLQGFHNPAVIGTLLTRNAARGG